MVKCFKGAKLVLNFLRDFNYTSHNFRTMEATGIGGGALLTKRTFEQAEVLFREGEHLFCYDDAPALRDMIPQLLGDPSRLRTVAANAQLHVNAHHLLRSRIEQVLSDVGERR
jgi:spore maturation protein CgeB